MDISSLPTASPTLGASRQRARGEVRAHFARAGARTEAARAYETGGLRLRFPRARAECEAVIVNTGGGMAGGDLAKIELTLAPEARVAATTQSAEKIYRCDEEPVRVATRLAVEAGGALAWTPQETLLFDKAWLERSLEADVAPDASLLLMEAVIFGRLAHGETQISARLRDRWRVRRAGRLVFADETRLDNAGAALDRPAVGGGARAIALILCVAPNVEAQLPNLRAALDAVTGAEGERLEAGASAFDGLLVARIASPSPSRLRAALIGAMVALRGVAAPRVWS
ncbi:MAG: urease accessory protein UreD [Hyphomicrobiales bacterium]|nr:urease accessory protein UreD [Hyphomicrobiales bacterium]MBV8664794.1 urease accessory protein UreD [Hyphomicrobiales bacterium]